MSASHRGNNGSGDGTTDEAVGRGDVIKVVRLREGARMPSRGTPQASGFDVYACLPDGPVEIGQRPVVVPVGIALEIPPGLDVQCRPRSGLARQGVLSTFGTIDADYRGELMITMYTTAPDITYLVRDGDRIAQLVVSRLVEAEFVPADTLSPTERGSGGHGSTGR